MKLLNISTLKFFFLLLLKEYYIYNVGKMMKKLKIF